MIVVDSREKIASFLPENGGADERSFLKIGTNWSYDFEIRMPFKPGETPRIYKVERKDWADFCASMFDDDKLTRQVSYVDILVVEMNPDSIEAVNARYAPKDILSFQKRLARLSAPEGPYKGLWVIPTLGPEHTLGVLRYIEAGRATRQV